MFKKIFILPLLFISFCVVFYLSRSFVKDDQGVIVAITQIAPHPSLDKIREGITEVLLENGVTQEKIAFQNAQGNPTTALQIAQKFVSMNPRVIVPITTPSAQAALSAVKTAHIPIIFSAVSDPLSAKIIDPTIFNPYVAGVSDLSPVKAQVDLLIKLMGKNIAVGVLYNAGEANSVTLVDLFEKEARAHGLTIIRATVSSTNDAASATLSLVGKGVKAIFIPNDNTVISAFESVLRAASTHKIPIFTADPESVERGALASIAFDQREVGRETGRMVVQFLAGEKMENLGVRTPRKVVTSLNKNAATTLGVDLPEDLLQTAHIVPPPFTQTK
jgi:putative ABC transport system substrate-binding protein